MESWKKETRTYYKVTGPLCPQLLVNEFVWLESDGFTAIVKEAAGKTAVLETLIDHTDPKDAVWGITARNREQNFALNLLLNPESSSSPCWPGRTARRCDPGRRPTQVLESKQFVEIIMTRVTVPVGEDIGFLPAPRKKMAPWMGALEDISTSWRISTKAAARRRRVGQGRHRRHHRRGSR